VGAQRPEIYLDHAATSPPHPEVVHEVLRAMRETYGNPSSLHRKGLEAERAVGRARETLAAAIGARREEIVFTSGGTESNNLALRGALRALGHRGRHIITTAVEHPSVLEVVRDLEGDGFRVTLLAPDRDGTVRVEDLGRALAPDTVMVSMMAVNNEVGAVQPVAQAAALLGRARPTGGRPLFHVDASQALGRLPLDAAALGADLVTFSAHKLGGPKGAGGLFVRHGTGLRPLLLGGGQEGGLRSGTENVPAIAGMAVAVDLARRELPERTAVMSELRRHLIEAVFGGVPEARLNGPAACADTSDPFAGQGGAAPHIACFSFPGAPGEVVVHCLEEEGIYVSTGAACSSRKRRRSHVLEAMGLPDADVDSAIRVSLGPETSDADIDRLAEVLGRVVRDIRRFARR